MSHKHRKTLEKIYTEPVSGNIHWRDIETLLTHLGARTDRTRGARMSVSLNGVEGQLHRPHHGSVCGKHDIRHFREFLSAAGVTLSTYH
jgi:hypothetical protein